MPVDMNNFDHLVQEAWSREFFGWDWSYLKGRMQEETDPLHYLDIVRQYIQSGQAAEAVNSLLEMGTGGGELFATLGLYPARTIATEAYPPSVFLAGSRLHPLGVQVVQTEEDVRLSLPFSDHSFTLAVNRHSDYAPIEVFRILRPGGHFITQQVGGQNQIRLNQLLLGNNDFIYSYWLLDYAVKELQAAGFHIVEQKEAFPKTCFMDIGAVVFYLKVIFWQIPGFNPDDYYEKLQHIHQLIQKEGCLETYEHRFIIDAWKPD